MFFFLIFFIFHFTSVYVNESNLPTYTIPWTLSKGQESAEYNLVFSLITELLKIETHRIQIVSWVCLNTCNTMYIGTSFLTVTYFCARKLQFIFMIIIYHNLIRDISKISLLISN